MKSRIIKELHKIADGKSSDYGSFLKSALQFSDDQLQNRAKLLVTMLLHDYGRLAVTTIDRFFQRILKSFTRELGIFPGYNVELDSDYVLAKAVDRMMQQVKGDANLRNWIAELMSNSVEEGKSWGVKAKIMELGEELFKENYMLLDSNVLEKFSDRHFLKDYRTFLQRTVQDYERQLREIGEQGMACIAEAGLSLADFKGNRQGCAAYFYKLMNEDFDPPTATARKGIDNLEGWVTQKSPVKATIESLFPQLNAYLKDAVGLFDTRYRNYLSAVHISGNLYQLGILNDLYGKVREYCNEKGVMLLSDTTRILNQLIGGNDTSFLFEKTGNYYKHLMIDEFQDTSAMQWKNFKPLMVNSLSEGCRALIVGDVKQSIYRWRNGDWGLLAHEVEQEFYPFGVNNVTLEDNWRSAKEIVNFNNLFFERAAKVLKGLYDRDTGGENPWSEAIPKAYAQVKQNPRREKTGYVDVLFGPEKKEEDSAGQIMKEIVTLIGDILQRGGQQKDIVILVRGGKEGAFVANYLMEYNKTASQPIPFISNDSLYVWSSPYVQFIVAVLKYMVEPYDQVNSAAILYFYQAFVQGGNGQELDNLFKGIQDGAWTEFLQAGLEGGSDTMMSWSLYETIEAIIERFALCENQEEVPYLIAFQDVVYEYESNNSNSIPLFLEWWEKEQGKRVLCTSEEVNAVRILTIHKSKGLEFEYVILPFCSWELDSVRPVRCIWCGNKEEEFNRLEYVPVNYSSKLINTVFVENYYDEHLKAYVDNLNLLYVALTRAKTELYLRPYTPKINKDGSVSVTDISAFIWQVFMALKEENCDFLSDGNMNVTYGKKQIFEAQEQDPEVWSLERYPVYEVDGRISVRYRYQDYSDPAISALSAVDEGKLLHEIFRSIEYTEDVQKAVWKACEEGLISRQKCEEYTAKIQEYISGTQASEWFAADNRIINERDILFPGGSKARPDRVIVAGDKVQVIDYKFGQSEEAKYLKQVRYYCKALEKMGYPRVEGYIWYVKAGKIVRV